MSKNWSQEEMAITQNDLGCWDVRAGIPESQTGKVRPCWVHKSQRRSMLLSQKVVSSEVCFRKRSLGNSTKKTKSEHQRLSKKDRARCGKSLNCREAVSWLLDGRSVQVQANRFQNCPNFFLSHFSEKLKNILKK